MLPPKVGRIAKAVDELLARFALDLRASGWQVRGVVLADGERIAIPVALPALCEASDFVSVHVPASPRNGAILGRREFEMMKPTAIVINTSRGSVLDEEALTTALLAGRLGGAGDDCRGGAAASAGA